MRGRLQPPPSQPCEVPTTTASAIRRVRSNEERARRAAKRALLPAELVAAMVVETETDRFALPVRRRSSETEIVVRRRAGDGVLEGPACAGCGASSLRLYLCDEQLHVLCDGCGRAGRLDSERCRGCRPQGTHPPRLAAADPCTR